MSRLADRVRDQLKRDAIEEALATLIEAWHELRAPAIADAIDAIDSREPTPEALETTAWIAAARTAETYRERGALLRTIAKRSAENLAMAMKIAAALRWDDPRLTTRIVELLTTIPFSGKRTRDVWRAIFDTAKVQQDPRFLIVAKTLPPTWTVGADTQTFLTNRLKEVTKGLAEVALPADVEASLRELIAEIAPPRAAPETASSLLDAIYANPDDDQARMVYADWLQERDDPRGELIALQLLPEDRRDRKAEQALIKQHKKQWLGPLATVFAGDVEFRRGFVAKGTARFRHQRDAEQIGTLREWATVEELAFNPSGSRDDQEPWTRFLDPVMTGLRTVRFPDARWLLEASRPWRLEEVWLATDEAQIREVCASSMLPKLRNLVVRGPEPAFLHDLTTCPPHVTVIDGRGLRDDARRRAWFAGAVKLPLERFTILWFGAGELHHHFTRDETGALTRLEIEIRNVKHEEPTEYEIREINTELEMLAGSLTHFDARFVRHGQSRPVPELVRAGQKIVRT